MNRSNMTSMSFTVDDDLVSESSLNSTQRSRVRGLKPFSNQYRKANNFEEQHVNQKKNQQMLERAQIDAYREQNEQIFNPFQHKLGQNFIPKESDLYERQKKRQLDLLRKQQDEMMSSKKNYTIVFHQEKKSTLQMAGKNVLDENASISDYYKNKFQKRKKDDMENIQQQDEDQEEHKDQNKKIDNFMNSIKKVEKNTPPPKKKIEVPKQISSMNEINSYKGLANQEPPGLEEPNPIIKKRSSHEPKRIPEPQPKKPAHDQKQYKKETVKKPPVPKVQSNKNIQKNKNGEKKKYSDVYEGPDRNLVEQLQRELASCPNITFDDIAELDTAKNLLQEAILLPRLMPQFFKGIRKAMKGVLLFGPPGTGKTLLAKAVAQNNIFLNVSASSLASKWKGESEKMVKLLFEIAKYHSPSVIFFDEIDAIGSRRSQNEHDSARKVKTELLVQMDGVGSTENQVFVLAATNRPWDLDEALRRRLEKRIYIPLPGKQGRKKMFDINMKDLKIAKTIKWEKIIEMTKGHSGADICNVCRDAAYMPMRRKLNSIGGIKKLENLKQQELIDEQVTQSDLIQAAKKVKPSVGQEDLKKYSAWMAQFGSS